MVVYNENEIYYDQDEEFSWEDLVQQTVENAHLIRPQTDEDSNQVVPDNESIESSVEPSLYDDDIVF